MAFAASSYGMVFDCNRNDCDQCPPVVSNCKNVRKCGCCDICEDSLKIGDSCVMQIFMPTLNQKECGPGLLCDPKTHSCQPRSPVLAELLMASRNTVVTQHNKNVSCSGNECYCVHKGKRIENYDALKLEHVNKNSCNCAVDKEIYQRTGLIGKMIYCNEQGGYKNIQCIGSVCHCVDETGEKIENSTDFGIGEFKSDRC